MDDKWFLVASNVSYVVPAIVCLYKMRLGARRRLDGYDGGQLMVLFLFVAFFSSWSYHSCRADLNPSSTYDADIPPCAVCPSDNTVSWAKGLPGASFPMTYQLSRFVDYFLASFTVFMTLLVVIPLHSKLRQFLLILAMVWIVMFLMTGNEAVALLPSLLALILVVVFWWAVACGADDSQGWFTRNKAWAVATVFMIAAVACFLIVKEPYAITHSLWHIFSALAAAFLLMRTATCYQDIRDDVKLPEWCRSLFTDPESCKRYDREFQKCSPW